MPVRKYIPNITYNAITKAVDKYIAVGTSGMISTSDDGRSWKYGISGTAASISSILYLSPTYIVTGAAGLIRTSPDLINWTTRISGTSNALNHTSKEKSDEKVCLVHLLICLYLQHHSFDLHSLPNNLIARIHL